ncbi:MAG: agmatinase [Chloroflexi bacterium]|nr:agmatinase [Chloroflexota bacterium]
MDLPPSLTAPRYMDIPTFMRTHLITDPAEFDIAIIGVPYDGAVTNRPGARHGPRELRNASSLMRTIHHVTRVNPYEVCRIGDGGDVHFTRVYEIEPSHTEITSYFANFHEAGVVPLAAGGDHSITFPILRAIVKNGPVGLIHIDAHTDTWDEFMGSRYSHGSPFRRGVEENLLDPQRTIQIGIRGAQTSSEGWDYSRDIGMRVIFIEEFNQLGVEAAIAEARRIVGDGPTYLSFDIDSLDPAYAPGTGTPEVGGLTSIQAQELLRGLRGLNLIGADVVEVAPAYDQTGNTALVGATMMYEILCLLAESVG